MGALLCPCFSMVLIIDCYCDSVRILLVSESDGENRKISRVIASIWSVLRDRKEVSVQFNTNMRCRSTEYVRPQYGDQYIGLDLEQVFGPTNLPFRRMPGQ